MRAECPNCKTSFVIDNSLPLMSNGTIVCSCCNKGFDVEKVRNVFGFIKVLTRLRNE